MLGTELELYGPGHQVFNNLIEHTAASSQPAVYCGLLTYPIVFYHNDNYSPAGRRNTELHDHRGREISAAIRCSSTPPPTTFT